MKSIKDYTVVVRPDEDGFLAYIPAIPGCHASADTVQDVWREIGYVFEMFCEDFAESGKPLPDDIAELTVAG